MTGQILNIAGYKFVTLGDLNALKNELKNKCLELELKGTILLSTEGTNQFLSGTEPALHTYIDFIKAYPAFSDLHFKESWSESQPFNRLLVKIKPEIVTMGVAEIDPLHFTAPYISPAEFKQWMDEQKDFTLLDTRNRFEAEMGSFDKAIDLNLTEFRSFPQAVSALPKEAKDKPVVIFCTGGIRCEKAGPLMLNQGFKEVYQLDGGILNYFEQVGSAHFHGECFVFDERIAVDASLAPVAE